MMQFYWNKRCSTRNSNINKGYLLNKSNNVEESEE